MNKIKPIKPKDVDNKKIIPNEVISTFNTFIAKKWNGRKSIVKQNEVIKEILINNIGTFIDRNEIFDKNYLDIEDIYRKAGWIVKYDKPAIGDDYEAFWTFSKE